MCLGRGLGEISLRGHYRENTCDRVIVHNVSPDGSYNSITCVTFSPNVPDCHYDSPSRLPGRPLLGPEGGHVAGDVIGTGHLLGGPVSSCVACDSSGDCSRPTRGPPKTLAPCAHVVVINKNRGAGPQATSAAEPPGGFLSVLCHANKVASGPPLRVGAGPQKNPRGGQRVGVPSVRLPAPFPNPWSRGAGAQVGWVPSGPQ